MLKIGFPKTDQANHFRGATALTYVHKCFQNPKYPLRPRSATVLTFRINKKQVRCAHQKCDNLLIMRVTQDLDSSVMFLNICMLLMKSCHVMAAREFKPEEMVLSAPDIIQATNRPGSPVR